MFNNALRCLMAPAAITSPVTASAKVPEPQILTREGNWRIDYANTTCSLIGVFGQGPDQVIFWMTNVAPGESPRLQLIGERLGSARGPRADMTLTFTPTTITPPPGEGKVGTTVIQKRTLPTIFVGSIRLDNTYYRETGLTELPVVTPAIERAVKGVDINIRGVKPFTLALQSMGAPMTAMRQCVDSLVTSWGFDPQELKTRQSRAKPLDVGNWINPRNYPKGMLNNGQSATVTFRIMVDANGAPTDCIIQEATSPREVGPETCKMLMQKAKFQPAKNRDGAPVPDFFVNQVSWYMRE